MSTALAGAVGAWLSGFSQRLGLSAFLKLLKIADPALIFARGRYRKQLAEKLAEMPFLFKDMSLSARDDYVALEVLTAQAGHKVPTHRIHADREGPLPKFKAYPRALIFGNGGYGKTTLFRNLAIRCLDTRPWKKLLGRRGELPIYLPLKVVKTSLEFPIIEALQSSDRYFEGHRGLRRITRLANSGKLIVLLDGYDEMPYTGGFEHVRRELEYIFDDRFEFNRVADLRDKNIFESSRFSETYRALRQARVYLASRLEFFDYNPIRVSTDVQKWEVRGLEDRRIELVEKIFLKYRARTVASSGRDLNSELFLQELIKTGDTSVIELSKSPLFLTVMCYVYANGPGFSADFNVFSLGSSELSKVCIHLLLQDLDKFKSQGSPTSERQAILNRRSAYPSEKFEFLSYFAVKLYEQEKSFFLEPFVLEVAERYFSEECRSPYALEISRGLPNPDATANIVKQIILSGLFVLVDKREGARYFDFPHRKFREALAVDYFSHEDRIQQLLLNVSEKPYAELVLAFVDQSPEASRIVKRLIELVAVSASSHVVDLFVDVLSRLSSEDAETAVMSLIQSVEKRIFMQLPSELLNFVRRNEANWRFVSSQLDSVLDQSEGLVIHRWACISARVDLMRSVQFIESKVDALCFYTLRSLVHSPLMFSITSPLVRRYFLVGMETGQIEVVVADLLKKLYIGKSDSDKKDLKRWLLGQVMPKHEPIFSHLVRFASNDDGEDRLDFLLQGYREFGSSFKEIRA